MRNRLVKALLIALFAFLTLGSGLALVVRSLQSAEPPPLASVGTPAPRFALSDQEGRIHSLADYKGRPIVLTFYSELTPAVKQKLRSLQEALPLLDRAGAKVFGITSRPAQEEKPFHDSEHLGFPLLSDPEGRIARAYGAQGVDGLTRNVSFVADEQGFLVLALPEQEINLQQHGQQLLRMASCCLAPKPTNGPNRSGETIANFSLPRVDNGALEALLPQTHPRAVVVWFLSSKCPCSQGYDARMKALAVAYMPRGVRFLGVNSSADETAADAAAHARKVGLPFPVVKDEENRIADRMQARITPEVFLLDDKEILRYHGRIDDSRDASLVKERTLQAALDALLAGKHLSRTEVVSVGCAIVRAHH